MAEIRLEGVWKLYGKTRAVRGVSLDIRDGEFMALLGPSGCGKTSTLRMIAGLERITRGLILFDGKVVNELAPPARNVALAFENYALYPTLSVWDNVAFPLVARGMGRSEIARRVDPLLEVLEIRDVAAERPRRLSDGQKQRVSLARALVRKPAVLLLDEPLSHLDARQRVRMRAYLKRLHLETGTTTVMVTHDQVEALAVADRVAVMHDGLIEQVSPPAELYDRPMTQFVAGFIGEPPMNFLPCRLVSTAPSVRLSVADTVFDLPGVHLPDVSATEEVVFGVRSESIGFLDPGDPSRHVAGQLTLVENLGDETVVTVQIGRERIHVLCPDGFHAARGTNVGLRFRPDATHLYSVRTGQRLALATASAADLPA